MIKDTKIISIISELENYMIEYKKRYTSFVEDFNVFQDDDSDSEIGFKFFFKYYDICMLNLKDILIFDTIQYYIIVYSCFK